MSAYSFFPNYLQLSGREPARQSAPIPMTETAKQQNKPATSSIWKPSPRTGKLQEVGLRCLCFLLILVWAGVSVQAQEDDPPPPRSFFDVEVWTTNRNVVQGSSTTFNVSLIAPPSSVVEVDLSVSGLPTGVTGSFNPGGISVTSPATLTISASSDAAVGSYSFTVTGTDGGLTVDVTETVTVIPLLNPDFELSVSPSSQKVDQGFSVDYMVELNRLDEFFSSVSLSVSGLPTGVTGSFSDASLSGSESRSTLTISAATGAAVGSDSFTVTGTGGNLTRTDTTTVVVIRQPTSISFSPGMVEQGECYTTRAGNAANMTLDLRYRFNGGTTQTITGWPTLNANGESEACTSTSNPVGSYVFTGYKNTEASNWLSISRTVVVKPPPPDPNFSVSVPPGSKKVVRGSSVSYRVAVTRNETFTGTVSLSVSGLGSGLMGSFSPTSVSFSSSTAPSSKTSTLTISAEDTAALVTDTFTVTGTGGGLTRDDTAVVVVTDFSVSVSPGSKKVPRGSSGEYMVTVDRLGGFTGTVSLSVSGLGSGLMGSFSPTLVSFSSSSSSSSKNSTLTISAGTTAALGSDTFTVTGTSGGLTRDDDAEVVVTDFSVSVSPLSQEVARGSSGDYEVTVSREGGFTGTVELSVSGLGSGLDDSFSDSSLSSSQTMSTLTIDVGATAPTGSDTFTVKGTSGGLTRDDDAEVVVTDFSVSVSPLSQEVATESSGDYEVTVSRTGGFTGTVELSVSGLGSGLTGNFSPASVSFSSTSSSSKTSTLTIDVGATAPTGSDTFTVKGTSGSLTDTAGAEVVITDPFSLSISPASQETTPGNSITYMLTVQRNSGFTGTVALSVRLAPGGGLSYNLLDDSLSPSQTTANLDIRVASVAQPDSHTVTATATGGGVTRTATATLEVVPPPQFYVAVAPPSTREVARGSSGTYTVRLSRFPGFTDTVTLSVSDLGAGVTGSFSDASLSGSESMSTLTISVGSSATVGSDSFTVTGTSGDLTHSVSATVVVTGAGDFTLAVSPLSQEAEQSSSVSYMVTLNPSDGFSSPVTLSVAGLGSGITGSFSPASVSSSALTSTLTISVATTVAPCRNTFTIRGTSGDLVRTVTATVAVKGPEDFTLSVLPSSQEVEQGSSGRYTVKLKPSNGFSSPVALSVSGLGSGITGSFSSTSLSSTSKTSMLTISTASTATTGSDSFTIRGTSGSLTQTVSATAVVMDAPDFTLSLSPTSRQVEQGSSVSYTVTLNPSNGFNSSVALSVSGLGSGVTGSFSSTSLSSSSNTSTLTISTTSTATTGSDSFTVTGTSGSLTQTVSGTVMVTDPPDFTLSLSPTSRQVQQGSLGRYTVTLNPSNGFNSSVALSVSGLGSGITGSFSPRSLSPTSKTSTLTIRTDTTAATGSDKFTVTGRRRSLTRTVTATVVVTEPDFTLSLSPSSPEVGQGSSGSYTVTLNPSGGFSSPVALSISGLGSGITGSFSPPSVSSSSPTSTLTISVGSSAATGSDSFTVSGTGGSLTRTVSATVVVTDPPDFTLSLSPSSQEVGQGSSGSYTVTLNPSGGFSSSVALSVSGLGSGVTGSFSPTSVSPASPTSTLTISVGSSATIGSGSFTISGTGGSLTRTVSATVVVTDPPDFALLLSPSSRQVGQGSSGSYTVRLNPSGGFSSSVTLSVSGLGSGVTGSFSSTSVSSSAPTSTLTISVGSSATIGSDSFTITGTGGSLTRTVSATVVVTDATAADFSLSVSPFSALVAPGSFRTYEVTLNPLNGFSSTVSLSVSGLGSGITGSLSPTTVSPSANTSTLTVTTASSSDGATGATGAASSPAIGPDELTITGTGGGLTRSVSATINVLSAESALTTDSEGSAYVTGENATGTTPYGSYAGQNESINLYNGNLNIVLPLFTLRGRNGMDITLVASYNSTYQYWTQEPPPPEDQRAPPASPVQPEPVCILLPLEGTASPHFQFHSVPLLKWKRGRKQIWVGNMGSAARASIYRNRYILTMPDGTRTEFMNKDSDAGWVNETTFNSNETFRSFDGSQMQLREQDDGVIVYFKNGTQLKFPTDGLRAGDTRAEWMRDSNGNTISYAGGVVDTLGREVVERGGGAIEVKNADGETLTYTLTTTPDKNLQILTLPNGLQYTMEYTDFGPLTEPCDLVDSTRAENRPAESLRYVKLLTQITYPSGGYTRYSWEPFELHTTYKLSEKHLNSGDGEATTKYDIPGRGRNPRVRVETVKARVTRPDESYSYHTFTPHNPVGPGSGFVTAAVPSESYPGETLEAAQSYTWRPRLKPTRPTTR